MYVLPSRDVSVNVMKYKWIICITYEKLSYLKLLNFVSSIRLSNQYINSKCCTVSYIEKLGDLNSMSHCIIKKGSTCMLWSKVLFIRVDFFLKSSFDVRLIGKIIFTASVYYWLHMCCIVIASINSLSAKPVFIFMGAVAFSSQRNFTRQ